MKCRHWDILHAVNRSLDAFDSIRAVETFAKYPSAFIGNTEI